MSKADRFNEGKLKWSLVHFKSLEPLVRVLEYGAEKYSPDNWRHGLDQKEIIESMLRHIFDYLDGNFNDKESGLPHIGHIMANAMFLSYFDNIPDVSAMDMEMYKATGQIVPLASKDYYNKNSEIKSNGFVQDSTI